jgi:[acyl-carrier-protein] S-malonyltransferase
MLPVSAPFHCSLMQPAAEAMDEALERVPLQPFRLPLYANVTAKECTDPNAERLLLVEQVTGRVRWRESVLAMKAAGVDHFVELGGKVLGPMVSRTVEDVKMTSVVTMADIEALAKEI